MIYRDINLFKKILQIVITVVESTFTENKISPISMLTLYALDINLL